MQLNSNPVINSTVNSLILPAHSSSPASTSDQLQPTESLTAKQTPAKGLQTPDASRQLNQLDTDTITHLQNAKAVQSLPLSIKHWLDVAIADLGSLFKQEFPDKSQVNRQDVAANPAVQALLKQKAENLIQQKEFSPALSGKFILSRVRSQPQGSVGARPSETDAGMTMAAFHTAAGLAEIVCKNKDNWPTALEKHFNDVGVQNLRSKDL